MPTNSPVKKRYIVTVAVLVLVVLVAAGVALLRNGGDDSVSPEPVPTQEIQADDTASKFQWKDKKADSFGDMEYLPEDERGQILSEQTRSYDTLDEARAARPQNVVFQAVKFSAGWPIPFSTSDGPTGFNGSVPIGYTNSAAGAALAAGAYFTQIAAPPTGEEYARKVFLNPTSENIERLKENSDKNRAAHAEHEPIVGDTSRGFTVTAFEKDYARVAIYVQGTGGGEGSVMGNEFSLEWKDNMWKVARIESVQQMNDLPEGVETWDR